MEGQEAGQQQQQHRNIQMKEIKANPMAKGPKKMAISWAWSFSAAMSSRLPLRRSEMRVVPSAVSWVLIKSLYF